MRLGIIIEDKTFRWKFGLVPNMKCIFSKEAWKTPSVVHDELMSNLRSMMVMRMSTITKSKNEKNFNWRYCKLYITPNLVDVLFNCFTTKKYYVAAVRDTIFFIEHYGAWDDNLRFPVHTIKMDSDWNTLQYYRVKIIWKYISSNLSYKCSLPFSNPLSFNSNSVTVHSSTRVDPKVRDFWMKHSFFDNKRFISQRSLLCAPYISSNVSPFFCLLPFNNICLGPENRRLSGWKKKSPRVNP